MYIFAIYMKKILQQCTGFDWDDGNSDKNWILHQVGRNECEQVFFNEPLVIAADEGYSQIEKRWFLLGRTDSHRLLFVVFTLRGNLTRVISARDMHKKERRVFNEL
jgi:uncharacterized DUF497 family protein